MSNGFPYWQFHCDRWLTGNVSSFDLASQGLFLNLCISAWVAQGPFNICSTLLDRRFHMEQGWTDERVHEFLEVGMLVQTQGMYQIKFVDAQLEHMAHLRDARSRAGKASAEARASDSPPHTPPPEEEEKSKGNLTTLLNGSSTSDEQMLKSSGKKKRHRAGTSPYGELKSVYLTDEELAKLRKAHQDDYLRRGIEILDGYIAAKPKDPYVNHYAVLKKDSWVWREVIKKMGRPSTI